MDGVRRLCPLLMLVALAVGGCAKAHAKTQPEPIALDVPLPPARVIAPPAPDEPLSPPVTEPPARQEKPAHSAPSHAEPRTETPHADRKAEPPPVPEPVKPAPASPAPTLQQAMPASPVEVERQVRDQIALAQRDLGRVDYGGLSADGKSQYDTAKRFIEQADQALKEKNLVLAGKLAEKAAGLAGVLVGR
jgi:outer membrane biosynthesis protein TonB